MVSNEASLHDVLVVEKREMDPSEGRLYIEEEAEQKLPPLYDAVNGNDSDHKQSYWRRFNINRNYLPFKVFYYFFYGAIGSLFPYIALYFRHLWLTPSQTGILVGLRPIVQSFATPLWSVIADRINAKKIVLFIGLCGWLFAHTTILLVPAGKKPLACNDNATDERSKRSVHSPSILNDYYRRTRKSSLQIPELIHYSDITNTSEYSKLTDAETHRLKNSDYGKSYSDRAFPRSQYLQKSRNKNIDKRSLFSRIGNSVSPSTWHSFCYIFIVVLIGNFFASPAQTMANTAMLQTLGDESHKYGAQRCFGSIGWGVAAFVVGILVSMNHDSSLACKGMNDINYTPCFYAFGVLMLCALIAAATFKYRKKDYDIEHTSNSAEKSKSSSQFDYVTMFVCLAVFVGGFNMGFIQTFLFWHLQTLGGTQLLFSIIVAFNAIGEMVGFVLSVKLISMLGHLRTLALGIFAYAVRCTLFGVVENPWIVLSVEYLKALSSAAVWSSAMSYVGDTNSMESKLTSAMHALYWGFGYGGGSMLGGVLMQFLGARTTFLSLAVISLVVVILILIVNHSVCCAKRNRSYVPIAREQDDQDSDE